MVNPRKKRRGKGSGSVFKKVGTQSWYYKNPSKNVRPVSLETREYSEAVQTAKEKYGYLDLEDEQKQQERLLQNYDATRKLLEDEQKARIPLNGLLDEYALAVKPARRSQGKGEELKLSTRVIVGNFVKWARRNNPEIETIDQVSSKIAQDYFGSKISCKSSTYNRYLAELRVVWSRINRRHMRTLNPFDSVAKIEGGVVKKETSSKRPFTPEELRAISEKASGWIRLAVIIGYHSGLRLSDVITLAYADISNDGFISVEARKTGKDQIIYCPEIIPYIQEWRKSQGETKYVFQAQAETYFGLRPFLPSAKSADKDRRIKPDPTKASKQFQHFLRDVCKFNTKRDDDTVLGFHSLRVSNATYSERIGVSRDKIKERLAHSDIRITEGYIQRRLDEIKREMMISHKPLPALNAADCDNEVANLKAGIMAIDAKNLKEFKEKVAALLKKAPGV
jgi:integrase